MLISISDKRKIVGIEGALEDANLLALKRNLDIWYTVGEGKTESEREDFSAECLEKMTTKMRKGPSGRTRRKHPRDTAVFSTCESGCLFAGCVPAVFGSPAEVE